MPSEVDALLQRFYAGFQAERQASGRDPTVCIMGHHDYEAFQGAMQALYGGTLYPTTGTIKGFSFNGVWIHASYFNETGMVFGGNEQE